MEQTVVNPQVIDLINQAQTATMGAQVVRTSGAGKAYQSVAQSTAIAVQDATDALRNVATIATTATGVVVAQMLAGNDANAKVLAIVQEMVTMATTDYTAIGTAAGQILRDFPSG
jgi:methylphosphotriester-DNA--protein-cysteine methyltransferase